MIGSEAKNAVLDACKAVQDPLVSVGVLTYNQCNYIRLAIESILRQEVNFNYEIVIADDGSTDGTRDILLEYAEMYPQVIRLILQEENVGLVENSKCLKRACRGRYRATQEGDDYWIDSDRLQKQVDFLESNPDYVAVCGGLVPIDEHSSPCAFPWGGMDKTYKMPDSPEDYEKEDIENWKLPGHVGAWLAYNIFAFIDQETSEVYESYKFPGDRKTPLFTMTFGKVKVFPEKYMARRILMKSQTSHIKTLGQFAPTKVFFWAKETQRMDDEFTHLGLNMTEEMDKMFSVTFRELLRNPSKASMKACREVFRGSGAKFHYYCFIHKKIAQKMRKKVKAEGIKGLFKSGAKFFLKCLKKVFRINKSEKKPA